KCEENTLIKLDKSADLSSLIKVFSSHFIISKKFSTTFKKYFSLLNLILIKNSTQTNLMLTLNLFKKFIQKKFNKKKNTKLSYFVTNFSLKTKKFKLYFRKYLSKFYLWLICKKRFNEAIFRGIRRPYNVWIFFFNYSMHYYLLAKLYLFLFIIFFIL
ncbi:MAG: hypothetical protein NXI18_21725, partial [Alphaproteobacteria bacterium]|nr:hypothetical protein [Alphaproteobacteria bacterium]